MTAWHMHITINKPMYDINKHKTYLCFSIWAIAGASSLIGTVESLSLASSPLSLLSSRALLSIWDVIQVKNYSLNVRYSIVRHLHRRFIWLLNYFHGPSPQYRRRACVVHNLLCARRSLLRYMRNLFNFYLISALITKIHEAKDIQNRECQKIIILIVAEDYEFL